ncbi:MAG: zinc-ribbon domain-containing protein [Spirochaetaceae bacterium]|jgi:predicted RNA-binding Zn-ribbon protein involved in translation (DUF1610 family)|nr:zinc-ribbon domain-containing protein [Spirochaetaceae bacterium]
MKRARFFCENCGAEVGRNAKQCPKCGKLFASILCPSCGFSGEEFLFDQGCPVCGYSAPGRSGPEKPKKAKSGEAAGPREAMGALPWWVYVLTALALAGMFAAFLLFR